MGSNPPIQSVPFSVAEPSVHIVRYLDSVRPYRQEHAQQGIAYFARSRDAGDVLREEDWSITHHLPYAVQVQFARLQQHRLMELQRSVQAQALDNANPTSVTPAAPLAITSTPSGVIIADGIARLRRNPPRSSRRLAANEPHKLNLSPYPSTGNHDRIGRKVSLPRSPFSSPPRDAWNHTSVTRPESSSSYRHFSALFPRTGLTGHSGPQYHSALGLGPLYSANGQGNATAAQRPTANQDAMGDTANIDQVLLMDVLRAQEGQTTQLGHISATHGRRGSDMQNTSSPMVKSGEPSTGWTAHQMERSMRFGSFGLASGHRQSALEFPQAPPAATVAQTPFTFPQAIRTKSSHEQSGYPLLSTQGAQGVLHLSDVANLAAHRQNMLQQGTINPNVPHLEGPYNVGQVTDGSYAACLNASLPPPERPGPIQSNNPSPVELEPTPGFGLGFAQPNNTVYSTWLDATRTVTNGATNWSICPNAVDASRYSSIQLSPGASDNRHFRHQLSMPSLNSLTGFGGSAIPTVDVSQPANAAQGVIPGPDQAEQAEAKPYSSEWPWLQPGVDLQRALSAPPRDSQMDGSSCCQQPTDTTLPTPEGNPVPFGNALPLDGLIGGDQPALGGVLDTLFDPDFTLKQGPLWTSPTPADATAVGPSLCQEAEQAQLPISTWFDPHPGLTFGG